MIPLENLSRTEISTEIKPQFFRKRCLQNMKISTLFAVLTASGNLVNVVIGLVPPTLVGLRVNQYTIRNPDSVFEKGWCKHRHLSRRSQFQLQIDDKNHYTLFNNATNLAGDGTSRAAQKGTLASNRVRKVSKAKRFRTTLESSNFPFKNENDDGESASSKRTKPKKNINDSETGSNPETDLSHDGNAHQSSDNAAKLTPSKEGLSKPNINWSKRLANAAASVAMAKDEAERDARSHLEQKREAEIAERKALANDLKRRALGLRKSMPSLSNEYEEPQPPDKAPLGSLSALTKILDKKLYEGASVSPYIHATMDGMFLSAKGPMNSLLGYNHIKGDWRDHISKTTWNVAVVFGKCLVRDQVTVEYASRIRTLASLFKKEPNFSPSLLCFCGSAAEGNNVSDADAGYIFFRHMCEAQGIDLSGVEILLDTKSKTDAEAVELVTEKVKQLLPSWLQHTPDQENISSNGKTPKKVINLHFSFISTEYHLCNINDIHHRSPRQSVFKPILQLQEDFTRSNYAQAYGDLGGTRNSAFYSNYYADEHDYDIYGRSNKFSDSPADKMFSRHNEGLDAPDRLRIRGDVKTSWSFQYATYPYIHSKDQAVAYLGKCFLLGEELMPLLVNLKGVVEKTEFFQRDNYLMLSSIRRSLVSHVEELCHPRKSLKSSINAYVRASVRKTPKFIDAGRPIKNDNRPVEVVLESALHSLGRCIDLVRPAGLLVSSVTKDDWLLALNTLEHSIGEIHAVCDPDRPLRPSEWGKLIDGDGHAPPGSEDEDEFTTESHGEQIKSGDVEM